MVDIGSMGVATRGDRGDEVAEDDDEESGKRVNAWDRGAVLARCVTVSRYWESWSCHLPRSENNESKPRSNSSCLIWIVSSAIPSVHSCWWWGTPGGSQSQGSKDSILTGDVAAVEPGIVFGLRTAAACAMTWTTLASATLESK